MTSSRGRGGETERGSDTRSGETFSPAPPLRLSASPTLLLVGGGHAMLPSVRAARAWVEAGARVLLVSDCRYLYYSGMVPEYLGGVYEREDVRIDLAALCAGVGIPFVEAEAVRLEAAERRLHTADGAMHAYDLIAFDIGGRNPGKADGAVPTKPLHRIEALAVKLREVLAGPPAAFRLVIVGGGAAGVEVGLNVAARFAGAGRGEHLRLEVVESDGSLLPGFPAGLQRFAAERLRQHGAHLHLGARVDEASADGLRLENGTVRPADLVLWATGTTAPPIFREAHLPCDRSGFLRVHRTLQSVADPRVFGAGDCVSVEGFADLAKVGVHAVKQGPTLRDNLARALDHLREGRPLASADFDRFSPYPAAPLVLSTGRREGLWTSGGWWLRGRLFLRLKHFVDRRWMAKSSPAWQAAGWPSYLGAEAARG